MIASVLYTIETMQFIVIARDYKQTGYERREILKSQHTQLANTLTDQGKFIYAVDLRDNAGQINGTAFVVDFSSREELDKWLTIEPYMLGQVWENVTIIPCKANAYPTE